MLEKSAQAGQHSYAERGEDCYETPPEAVNALLGVEQLPEKIWEPACGHGNIVKALRNAGHCVYASDIMNYEGGRAHLNFLECGSEFRTIADAIVTNPPYQLAQQFVEKALELSPLVIMLLRLAFYESQRRTKLLEKSGLVRIHVFRNRLPMMHRKGWTGKKASSAIPFAWFVWVRGCKEPTTIDRISWEA